MASSESSTPADAEITEGISAVIGNLLAAGEAQALQMFEAVKSSPEIQLAVEAAQGLEPDDYYYSLPYKFQQIQEGLLASLHLHKGEVLFIFRHYDFLEMQLSSLFTRFEGRACSADKARTVVSALVYYFVRNEAIEFDRTQRYTYHLPSTVLTNQDEVLSFFRVVWDLYYGRVPNFVAYMQELSAKFPEVN